jgi:hypothetical protein
MTRRPVCAASGRFDFAMTGESAVSVFGDSGAETGQKKLFSCVISIGGRTRTRTLDPLIKSYQVTELVRPSENA